MKKSSIQKSTGTAAWFLVFLVLHVSCFQNFYKVTTDKPATAEKVNALKNAQNYFILHYGNDAWSMRNITLNVDEQKLNANLGTLPPDRLAYRTTIPTKPNRYYKQAKKNKPAIYPSVLDEVHIYLKDTVLDVSSGVISLQAIDRIDVYDPDKGATTASYVLGTLGATVAIVGLVVIIILLTKDSCPFVYVYNGETYVFAGEIYSGAIYGSLERDDYMLLPRIKSEHGFYYLNIANKLKEKQYTNLAELWRIEHPVDMKIFPDRHGKIHSIMQPITPERAYVHHRDVTPLLSDVDLNLFMFDDQKSTNDINQLNLSFAKPEHAERAKVILRAKNTFFGDYAFGEFTKYFGNAYPQWIESQRKASPDEHVQWMNDQGLLLKVYLETSNGWKFVDHFDLVGPMTERDLVMSIDLKAVNSGHVNLRLEAGYMLWEINYAAIDYSETDEVKITRLPLVRALNQEGMDVKEQLVQHDNQYLKQFNVGDEAELVFESNEVSTAMSETIILHTRGFYEHIRDYEGMPDLIKLRSFKEPGAFPAFVKEKWFETQDLVKETPIGLITRNQD